MDQGALITELAESRHDDAATARIVRQLAEPGAEAVPGLVAALPTVPRKVMLELVKALRLIGPPAFDAVLAAIARDEEVPDRWELGQAMRAFDARCIDRYVAALAHPRIDIRQEALWGLGNIGAEAAGAVPAMLPFLDDRDSRTRHRAGEAIRSIGRSAAPRLREIRREGPAHLRRQALAALALVGGEADIDAKDLRALERLVRIKITQDEPQSLPEYRWLAVPAATYEGLFDVMGLHDRRPCTISMGLSAMEDDMALVQAADGKKELVYRVFVTPELDGWRLIYADTALWEQHWDFHDIIERLSAVCGEAQVYFQDDHSDSMLWAVAKDGVLERGYWRYSDPEWIGEPLDWEKQVKDDDDDSSLDEEGEDERDDDLDSVTNASGVINAGIAACHLSIDPESVGYDTSMSGHGWLAVTAEGVGHTPFTGVLRI
ncbi:HEAT repeat domain-containing protein [Streptomyces sp. MST-110588]|uniref:HEAT repeat domain-containing protein n=1 Tax=Streptomyces sp. MST-110588 TaxID=2833628 RepID=UPI001F5C114F|nr:HEAT repeat domain-containing protein [Streptomyces sp. MST-110588]UNO38448.1 HEAT repeat domain-containing protein [Streptomyces sp. MST-110588]